MCLRKLFREEQELNGHAVIEFLYIDFLKSTLKEWEDKARVWEYQGLGVIRVIDLRTGLPPLPRLSAAARASHRRTRRNSRLSRKMRQTRQSRASRTSVI